MEMLGSLPNLMQLRLERDAYIGEKLAFKTGAFPNLKKLGIRDLDELIELKFEDGTSPQLAMIHICWCELRSGITGVNHLPKLQEISLGFGGRVAKLAMLQSEVDAHTNSPVLRLYNERSGHDLWDVFVQLEDVTGESSSLHPEPAAAGESSQSQAVGMATANIR
uniref:Disease resistance R13L4/SHOC-2-like LRR domain-containing protein n=1 Tax=Aegilops tauschii subsp. strangulata TaxID=200361 RepID=A0A453QF08_AEGTS